MDADRAAMPDDIVALKEALAAERAKTLEIAAELSVARAKAAEDDALIAHQKLHIAKLTRQIYGQKSERSSRLVDQLALTFEESEATATQDELAAEKAVAQAVNVRGFKRKRPERQTFPEHLPRERVVIDPPTSCACCGGTRLRKLGEDVTRTLECVPRHGQQAGHRPSPGDGVERGAIDALIRIDDEHVLACHALYHGLFGNVGLIAWLRFRKLRMLTISPKTIS
jgi:hypothetical protein